MSAPFPITTAVIFGIFLRKVLFSCICVVNGPRYCRMPWNKTNHPLHKKSNSSHHLSAPRASLHPLLRLQTNAKSSGSDISLRCERPSNAVWKH